MLVTIIASVRSVRRRFVAIDSRLRTSGHGQHLTVMERMPPRKLEACATGSLRTSGHGQHLTAVERNASTQAGSLRHGEHLQSSLTQRDMWVMHSLSH